MATAPRMMAACKRCHTYSSIVIAFVILSLGAMQTTTKVHALQTQNKGNVRSNERRNNLCLRDTIQDSELNVELPEGLKRPGEVAVSGNTLRSALNIDTNATLHYSLLWASDRLFTVNNETGEISFMRIYDLDYESGISPGDPGSHPESNQGRREVYVDVAISTSGGQLPRRSRRQLQCSERSFGTSCMQAPGCTNEYSDSSCRDETCDDYTVQRLCESSELDCEWMPDETTDFRGNRIGVCLVSGELPHCQVYRTQTSCLEQGARCSWLSSQSCVTNTVSPTAFPTGSFSPTESPSTSSPTTQPSTSDPSLSPTLLPTVLPTESPTDSPNPSIPTVAPSHTPTYHPTYSPLSSEPTLSPLSSEPTLVPSTSSPSMAPASSIPSTMPSGSPTKSPSLQPPCWPLETCRLVISQGRPSCINLDSSVCVENNPDASCPSGGEWQRLCGEPSAAPTFHPATTSPTYFPSVSPTIFPTTSEPTTPMPTTSPSTIPTISTANPDIITFRLTSSTQPVTTTTTYNYQHGYRYFGLDPDYRAGPPPDSEELGCLVAVRVVFKITDVNDGLPQINIDSSDPNPSVSEGAPRNTVVFDFGAVVTDPDGDARLRYGFIDATVGDTGSSVVNIADYPLLSTIGPFSIDQDSGIITLSETVDREATPSYRVSVLVVDQTGLGSAIGMTIDIVDENDNTPTFSVAPLAASVNENASLGTIIAHFVANDSDTGTFGRITYSVEPADIFGISDEGLLYVNASLEDLSLRFDTIGRAVVNAVIRATDGGTRSAATSISITVVDFNNGIPTFTGSLVAVIDENSQSEFIFPLTIQDVDSAVFDPITIVIVDVAPPPVDASYFRIDNHNLVVVRPFDFEELGGENVTVTLRAQDAGGLTSTTVFTLFITNVDDSRPTMTSGTLLPNTPFMCDGNIRISEMDSPGLSVLRLEYSDLDRVEETFTYEMTPSLDSFDLVSNGTYVTLRLTQSLDRESLDLVQFVITAIDSGNMRSTPCFVNVIVTDQSDVAPVFQQAVYYIDSVAEVNGATGDEFLITVQATDEDMVDEGQIRYSFENETGFASTLFNIDGTTGRITLRAGAVIDRDGGLSALEFVVRATDTGGNIGRAVVEISSISDIDDNLPTFFLQQSTETIQFANTMQGPLYSVLMHGNSSCDSYEVCDGTVVLQVSAVDIDEQPVTYSLLPSPDSVYFAIDTATGLITVSAPLDFEVQSNFEIQVGAGEPGSMSTATVAIAMTDSNDNAPRFANGPYVQSVLESAPGGYVLFEMRAEDRDVGDTFSYSIASTSQNVLSRFEFSENRLVVKSSSVPGQSPLDLEAPGSNVQYTFPVRVTDANNNYGIATVTITVTDENDSPAVLAFSEGQPDVITVSDIAMPGTNLFSIVGTDNDLSSDFNSLNYTIVDVQPPSLAFEVRNPSMSSAPGVHRMIGLKSQLTSSPQPYTLVVQTQNTASGELCQDTQCSIAAEVLVVPFVSPYERNGMTDSSKVVIDWRSPLDPCMEHNLGSSLRPASCPPEVQVMPDKRFSRIYSRRVVSSDAACQTPCSEDNSVCVCPVGMSTASRSNSLESTVELSNLNGNTVYEFQLRLDEEDDEGRNHTVYSSPWRAFITADFEIGDILATQTTEGTLVQWASPTQSNGVFNKIVVCWLNSPATSRLENCDSSVDGRETLLVDVQQYEIPSTDIGMVMVERETNIAGELSYTRAVTVVDPSTSLRSSEASDTSDSGIGSGLWTALIIILAIIIISLITTFLLPRLRKKSVDLIEPTADEVAMETLRNRLFSEDDDTSSPNAVGDPSDHKWDYFTAERANQFYPGGETETNIPYPEEDNVASPYTEVKLNRNSSGYDRSSVAFEPAPSDLPSQTPKTQRKDGFTAAFRGSVRTPSTIELENISETVSKLLASDGPGSADEQFRMIRMEEQSSQATFIEANQVHNREKNRYMNVKALDATRVKLSGGTNPGDDYINANFVDGWRHEKYIATQGPVPATFGHFWQMVWEQNSGLIVMVTKEFEMGRLKCAQYWPDLDSTMQAGDFEVCTEVDDRTDPAVIVRKVAVKCISSGDIRHVWHLQMLSWPDQNAPESPKDFLDFLNKSRELQGESDSRGVTGPPIVHCSAGIGRSGTFMLLDSSLKRLDNIGNVDPMVSVNHMRTQRYGSVQTLAQYRFILEAIAYYAENMGDRVSSALSIDELARIGALAQESSDVAPEYIFDALSQIA